MFFSKSILVALISVAAVAARVPSPSFPDLIGSKSVYITDDSTLSGGSSFTPAPTVTTATIIQTTENLGDAGPIMPAHTPHPTYINSSVILTGTVTGTMGSPGNSKNISKTMSITGSSTRFPLMPIVTVNGTKPTGTATPSNGTNRTTTSATLTPIPTSLGLTVTPYGAAFLAFLVGFVVMGL
ncbi:unnamed protein product [Tuber aestivum]|uniref:Uncharacterized protein n=1 Tax=Tuber aestivum TaxID=59557 RepID=A0A292Q150_9PEZI|nr:unnamed protein product [Tuber aestivum]